MTLRTDEEADRVGGGPQDLVKALHFLVGLSETSPVEEVVSLTQHQDRIRCTGDEEVSHVQTGADDAWWILFRVCRQLILQIIEKRGDNNDFVYRKF